jgi:hypothetical protein
MTGEPGSGIERSIVDDLLVGAFDLHRHGFPEMSLHCKNRFSDVDNLISTRDAGFRGAVIKSHFWPTVGRVFHLKNIVSGIEIYSSITLNRVVGGFDPISVESAALQGARVMWFPTWSAANDIERGGISKHILPEYLKRTEKLPADYGLRVTDESGKVRTEVKECLAVAQEHGMIVCTGHISARESIALAGVAAGMGITRLVFTHPDSATVGASIDDIGEMIKLGAVCEVCAIGFMPIYARMKMSDFVGLIDRFGASNVILTSDYFSDWFPSASEAIRLIAGTLLELGVKPADITTMLCRNPERLLGL